MLNKINGFLDYIEKNTSAEFHVFFMLSSIIITIVVLCFFAHLIISIPFLFLFIVVIGTLYCLYILSKLYLEYKKDKEIE